MSLDCRFNQISSEIPKVFGQLLIAWYDTRYAYSDNSFSDNKIGWWYPGEPETGYHCFYDVTGISLNKNTTSLVVGGSETLAYSILPDMATYKNVSWHSNNSAIATVDTNGKVTAITKGTATITACR